MHKTVAIYGVALALALVGAFVSWTWESDDSVEAREGVPIVSVKPDELEAVTYEEDDLSVTIERREDEAGEYVWATTSRTHRAAPKTPPASKPHDHAHGEDADAGADAAAHAEAPEPEPEPKEKTEKLAFKAGDRGNQVLDLMAPFMAMRKLEGATPDQYESYGLDDPRGELTLKLAGGETREFQVGGEGYGHRNVYVRDTRDGAVYLVDSKAVRPLRHADTRMIERNFFEPKATELEAVEISDGTSSVAAVQKNRDDPAARAWTVKGTDEKVVPLSSWIEKFLRARGTGYATPAEAKTATEEALTVKVIPASGDPVNVKLIRGQTETGDPAWFVQSEYTRGLMKITTAVGSDLANDFSTVVEAVEETKGEAKEE